MKFVDYKGGPVTGLLTLKIDGVRAVCQSGVWTSRSGKPLYNLPDMPDGVYEVYFGDWESSVSACRTHNGPPIDPDRLYQLYPIIDDRLRLKSLSNEIPPPIPEGAEGWVIHTEDKYIKIKHKYTYDVMVTGWQAGTGKHTGRLGALITDMGRVGTGFKDEQRSVFTEEFIVGRIIEVECMELTPAGRFRHPRFIRVRDDK